MHLCFLLDFITKPQKSVCGDNISSVKSEQRKKARLTISPANPQQVSGRLGPRSSARSSPHPQAAGVGVGNVPMNPSNPFNRAVSATPSCPGTELTDCPDTNSEVASSFAGSKASTKKLNASGSTLNALTSQVNLKPYSISNSKLVDNSLLKLCQLRNIRDSEGLPRTSALGNFGDGLKIVFS